MTFPSPPSTERPQSSWIRSRQGMAFLGFLAIAGYFLLSEHRAHFIQALPWLLLVLCPFMHLFLHGGHGRERGHRDVGRRGLGGGAE